MVKRLLCIALLALWYTDLTAGARVASIAAGPTVAWAPNEALIVAEQNLLSTSIATLTAIPAAVDPTQPSVSPTQPATPWCSSSSSAKKTPVWNSALPIPSSMNFTRVVTPSGSGSSSAGDDNVTCAVIAAAAGLWTTSSLDLGHSFVVFPSGDIAMYPDAPNASSWTCGNGGGTIPSNLQVNSAAYRSAITGQKDLLILWDVSSSAFSDALTMTLVKQSITSVLSSFVSTGDFVGVFPFAEITDLSLSPILVDVSDTSAVASLTSAVQAYRPASNAQSLSGDFSGALETVFDVQQQSAATGHSASCNTIVVVITAAAPFVNSADPESVVKPLIANFALFNFITTPSSSNQQQVNSTSTLQMLNKIACLSGGTTSTLTASTQVSNTLLSYFINVQQQLGPWYSLPHVSDFGTGEVVVTMLQPAYDASTLLVAVFGYEVPYRNVSQSGNVSVVEVDRILQLQQQCSPLFPQSLNAAPVDALQALSGMQCDDAAFTVPPPTPYTNAQYPLIFITCVVPLAMMAITFLIQQCRSTEPSRAYKISLFVFVALWLVALSVFWGVVWDPAARRKTLSTVQVKTTSVIARSHTCCDVGQCNCVAANVTSLPTCASLAAAGKSGQCLNGFHCCSQTCASCSCDATGKYCGSCCSCTKSVASDLCQTTCGTCTDITAFLEYNVTGQRYATSSHTSCGINDTGCVAAAVAANPVGRTVTAHVITTQPTFLTASIEVDTAASVITGAAVALSLIPYAIATYLAWHVRPQLPDVPRRDKSYLTCEVPAPPPPSNV